MARLEEIVVGDSVTGLSGKGVVTIISVKWHGNSVLELVFKDSAGQLGEQMLYREDEASLEIQDSSLPWSFDADADLLRLTSEAYRIHLAHLFDPYLAVHTSDVEPLPHQISAVYQEMLRRLPLRYILADDPGAGKTIMTGLFIKELIARGEAALYAAVTEYVQEEFIRSCPFVRKWNAWRPTSSSPILLKLSLWKPSAAWAASCFGAKKAAMKLPPCRMPCGTGTGKSLETLIAKMAAKAG